MEFNIPEWLFGVAICLMIAGGGTIAYFIGRLIDTLVFEPRRCMHAIDKTCDNVDGNVIDTYNLLEKVANELGIETPDE